MKIQTQLVFSILIGIILAFVYCQHKEYRKLQNLELQKWPEISASLPENVGELPRLPYLIPYPFIIQPEGVPDLNTADGMILRDRLAYMIVNHPETMVSLIIQDAIVNDQLLIELVHEDQMIVLFQVLPTAHGDWMPVLVFSYPMLALASSQFDVLKIMLEISRESQRYEQYLTADPKEKKEIFRFDLNQKMSEHKCQQHWVMWNDSYEHECEMANKWGVPGALGTLCYKYSNTPAFKQAMFKYLAEEIHDLHPECLETWAELAGHPHSEAYKLSLLY